MHQAQAILDMRACKGWKDLGYESQAEWLTQPEIDLTPSTARKLAWVLNTFSEAGVEPSKIATISPFQLAVTAKAVSTGVCDAERAIADAQAMHRTELEVRYSEDLDAPLDAEAEEEKWRCPECRHVHARMPKHMIEKPGTEFVAAGSIADEEGEVF